MALDDRVDKLERQLERLTVRVRKLEEFRAGVLWERALAEAELTEPEEIIVELIEEA